jgi:putative Mg2+ transporter-C (MgtC) family protein
MPAEWALATAILTKLGIGAMMAALIGWERELHGRPAGIRTHMLLIMGVILFSEASKGFIGSEASRVAAQVVVGVGFLGAGTIMRTGTEVKGLTTAASLWATAAIGMAVSLGGAFMLVAIISTVLALFTLVVVDRFEFWFLKSKRPHTLVLIVDTQERAFKLIEHLSAQHEFSIRAVEVVQSSPNVVMNLELRGHTNRVVEQVATHEGVVSARWEDGQ